MPTTITGRLVVDLVDLADPKAYVHLRAFETAHRRIVGQLEAAPRGVDLVVRVAPRQAPPFYSKRQAAAILEHHGVRRVTIESTEPETIGIWCRYLAGEAA